MDTVTNIANTASKAIWGDKTTEHNETGGQEPISGHQGKGTINDPYDQGNKENPTEVPSTSGFNNPTVTADRSHLASSTAGTVQPATTFGSSNASGTQENPISISNDEPKPSAAAHKPQLTDDTHEYTKDKHTSSDKSPSTSHDIFPHHTSNSNSNPFKSDNATSNDDKRTFSDDTPSDSHTQPRAPKTTENAIAGGLPGISQDSSTPGPVNKLPTNAAGTGTGMSNPADAAAHSGAAPPGPTSTDTKANKDHEGTEKPTDAPKGQQENAIQESKLSAEELLAKRDPNDHSGEPMHMHDGGDKGIADKQSQADSSKEPMPGMDKTDSIPATQAERRDSKIGLPGGQEHGKEYGTGDKWEKSTGMAAEGGDFDATRPGAGREADRLMADKGIHKTNPGEHPTPMPVSDETKQKTSVGEKIKSKLHIGSHK